jgi:hypothetical protein
MLTYWAHIVRFLAIFACIYAFWRGGPYEKRGAVILLIGWVLTIMTQNYISKGLNYGTFIIDIIGFCAYLWLSISSRLLWTLISAAAQLNTIACYILHKFIHIYGINTYVTAVVFWGAYGLTLALIFGTIGHDLAQREKKTA